VTLGPPPAAPFIRAYAIIDEFDAGLRLERAHPHDFGSVQFDTRGNANARFSTVQIRGAVVGVLYSGESRAAAASETIFHTVDVPGTPRRPRHVYVTKYETWQWSTIETARSVRLVRLDGQGLKDLNTTRPDIIEGDRSSYPLTRAWAAQLVTSLPDVDGFWWMSRQAPDKRAYALYARTAGRPGGIADGELHGRGPALPFALPAGLDELDRVALEFEITVVRP
jgi:hypothetical protein